MSRPVELYEVFEAKLLGVTNVRVDHPIELLVARLRIPNRGSAMQDPFLAYTSEPVDQICGAGGVRIKSGKIIPWDRLTVAGDVVTIAMVSYQHRTLPIINLKSLLEPR